MMKLRSSCTVTALFAALSLVAELSGQTLARPGWVGSGLSAQPWFRHAIFYEIDIHTFSSSKSDTSGNALGDIKGVTQHLDYIHSLGADAILLKPIAGGQPGSDATEIDPALGTLEDVDDLLLQASRLKIRILLELANPNPALARFWLTRGVAGFHIVGKTAADQAAIQAILKLLPTYVGQRVLITDMSPTTLSSGSRLSSNELILDRVVLGSQAAGAITSQLRTSLEESQAIQRLGTPILAVDGTSPSNPEPRLAKVLATFVLLNRSASLILAGQELGSPIASGKAAMMPWGQSTITVEETKEAVKAPVPVVAAPNRYTPYVPYVRPVAPGKPVPPDPATAAGQETDPRSLLNFYRELGRLHHGGTALHDGEETVLNHDDRDALIWVRKPVSPSQSSPPTLVACNPSDKPVVLSLKADVTRLQLHGSFLRTLLRSDDLMGGTSLDPITLPPFGVYIGDLRY